MTGVVFCRQRKSYRTFASGGVYLTTSRRPSTLLFVCQQRVVHKVRCWAACRESRWRPWFHPICYIAYSSRLSSMWDLRESKPLQTLKITLISTPANRLTICLRLACMQVPARRPGTRSRWDSARRTGSDAMHLHARYVTISSTYRNCVWSWPSRGQVLSRTRWCDVDWRRESDAYSPGTSLAARRQYSQEVSPWRGSPWRDPGATPGHTRVNSVHYTANANSISCCQSKLQSTRFSSGNSRNHFEGVCACTYELA